MARPQDALDIRRMRGIQRFCLASRAAPVLWDTFMMVKGPHDLPAINFESEEDFFEWCSETVHSFDHESCQTTGCEGSTFDHDYELRRLEGLADHALICHHREGSFDKLSPETVACCLHVANVISVSCFLFCLRIGTFQDAKGSVIDQSGLIDHHLSSLAEKWNWSGASCQTTFDQAIRYFQGLGAISQKEWEKEEALKLLFQWTLFPLENVLVSVIDVINSCASVGNDQYSKVKRVSKWSDELCDFLEDYRRVFLASDDTEFFYLDMFTSHYTAAQFHLTLGNHDRAKELLKKLIDMLGTVGDERLKVTRWRHGEIKYLEPEDGYYLITILKRMHDVSNLWKKLDSPEILVSFSSTMSKLIKELDDRDVDVELEKALEGVYISSFDRQLTDIGQLLGKEKFSEAREIFNKLDLSEQENKAGLRGFLEFQDTNKFYVADGRTTISSKSISEKQDLLLDFSEALGDRQLTAKILEQYAIMIGHFSNHIYAKYVYVKQVTTEPQPTGDMPTFYNVQSLQMWLKEDLNLQLTLPAPQCIQDVISCLRDPCKSDEHKRDLPHKLKACRLLKRAIDINSELLHNWTEGNSNDVDWLKLLESQKSAHELLLYFLLEIAQFCTLIMSTLECNNSAAADDALKSQNVNLHVYSELLGAILSRVLVWVERGRARTLLAQLGPWYETKLGGNPGSLKEELSKFDKDEEVAMSSIKSCGLACKGKPLFVEYVSHGGLTGPLSKEHTLRAGSVPTMYIWPVAFLMQGRQDVWRGVQLNTRSGIPFHILVEASVNKFYEMVTNFCGTKPLPRRLDESVLKELHGVLEELYDLLIRPFSENVLFKQLDPKAPIIFVPDKILYRVPFPLLRDEKTQKYLFQLHPIAIAPSLRVLQHCDLRLRDLEKFPLKPDGCILTVGNASYKGETLPGTGEELKHLQSCFPSRVKALEKDEATRANFLELVKEASNSKEQHAFAFIHLGVHGHWSNPGQYMATGAIQENRTGSLQFAKPPQQSGASKGLTMCTDKFRRGSPELTGQPSHASVPEIQELKYEAESSRDGERFGNSVFGEVGASMRAPDGYRSTAADDMLPSEDIIKSGFEWRTRLVVLSACNSSRGQDYSEGEVNLPRALMIAGVPTAVVSQWKVSDVGAPRLMKAFYQNLRCGQDVATALQSAMLQIFNSESESANNIFEWGPFLVWGLPTVQLPNELWTESARETLPARYQAGLLRDKFGHLVDCNMTLMNHLEALDTFLESVSCNTLTLKEKELRDATVSMNILLDNFSSNPHFSKEVIALDAEFYALLPALKQLKKFELELENNNSPLLNILGFSLHMMYVQAMKGRHQIALDYANNLIKVMENADGTYDEWKVQWFRGNEGLIRQERAVILRLMGKYDEASKEFEQLLAPGEDYECLIQMSYLKHLMKDEFGALECAHRAKKLESPDISKPGYGAFSLALKALPDEYRQRLLNVIAESADASSSTEYLAEGPV